jgi:predicted helicase
MRHLLKNNLSITLSKQLSITGFQHIFISQNIQESCLISLKTKEGGYSFPLYTYPEDENQQTIEDITERTPNLNLEIVKEIVKKLDLTFTNEKETTQNTFAPIDVLDYIYAVLHSPSYREKYKEFLKIDFPRVPYPKDQTTFWQLIKLGKEIREIHLLESETVENYITSYPETGDNIITRKLSKTNIGYEAITDTLGKVWINDTQYFNNVPLVAWEFYIGGYQPAQKWLKDRKGRELSFEDILHYQKIIVALSETDRLMQEIDTIEIE